MAKIYKSAQGKKVNMDSLRVANESTIAVGNMGVNGRGDLLGPGGQVIKTRDQIMKDYYSLNTPVAVDRTATADTPAPTPAQQAAPAVVQTQIQQPVIAPSLDNSGLEESDLGDPIPVKTISITEGLMTQPPLIMPEVETTQEQSPTATSQPNMRGSLADAVAKATVVTQTEKLPMKKANGIQRF